MTKTIHATFDGKAYVPDEPADIPVGTKVVFTVEVFPKKSPREVIEAIRGKMTHEEVERRLEQLRDWKTTDIRLQEECG